MPLFRRGRAAKYSHTGIATLIMSAESKIATHPAHEPEDRHAHEGVKVAANGQVEANLWLDVMGRLTIAQLVKLYCADACARAGNRHTAATYRSRARKLLELDLYVDGERRRLAELWVDELELAHVQQVMASSKAAAHTINNRIGLLHAAIGWGRVNGLFRGPDPLASLRWRKAPAADRALPDLALRVIVYGLDLAELVTASDVEWIDAIRILVGTGLRTGDLRRVLALGIDLERRWLTTRQKGDRLLEIAYPRSLDPIMRRRVEAARQRGWRYLFAGFGPGGKRTRDVALGKDKLRREWRQSIGPITADVASAREAAGLTVAEVAAALGCTPTHIASMEAAGFHGLDVRERPVTLAHFRSTNVTTKIRRGASTKLAGASVGHEHERTTEVYVGPLFEELHGVAELMDEYFDQGRTAATGGQALPDLDKIAGRNLKRIREGLRLSQEDLGELLGETGKAYSGRTIRDWETRGLFDLRLVPRIAKALGCSRAELLEGVLG